MITKAEWWNVKLVNGEKLRIKGAATSQFAAMLFQPGTTQLKLDDADAQRRYIPPLIAVDLRDGGLYTAQLTGTYPIAIGPTDDEGQDGPFSFTVTIYKNAFLFAPRTITAKASRTNRLTIGVRDKEGNGVSDRGVTVTLNGVWQNAPGAAASTHLLAKGHPVHGKVRFRYRLPGGFKGKRPRLVIESSGAGYQAIRSVVAKLTIARPRP